MSGNKRNSLTRDRVLELLLMEKLRLKDSLINDRETLEYLSEINHRLRGYTNKEIEDCMGSLFKKKGNR